MNNCKISQLLDMVILQKLADAHYQATGMPIGIIDALDGSILVGAGWQEICAKFHRAHPCSSERCRESDNYIKDRLVEGDACRYKCKNGMWDIGMPIIVAGRHLATMFLGQFFYEGETSDREFFARQAREFGYDVDAYLAALDRVPVFSSEKVNTILGYNKALVRFITDLAESSLDKIEAIEMEKRAVDALESSEAKYRIVADNTYDWEFWQAPNGTFIYMSPSCRRITGRDEKEFMADAELFRRIIHPDDLSSYDRHTEQHNTVTAAKLEYRIVRPDGAVRWIEHFCQPVFHDGGFRGTRGSNRDITERKQLEEELRQSQKMETVGLLAGGIAHDFNNLLTPILGYADLLLYSFPGEDPRREQIQVIRQAGVRAKELIRQLLTFSRRQLIELKTVDLGDLVRRSETILRRIIRENIAIEVHIPKPTGMVRANADQIEQALVNLAVNAQDAMPEGGVLSIGVTDINLDGSYTSLHPEIFPGPYVMIAVSDAGIGMDERVREHIFEPFYTTKETGKGTGLGLSTVYGIVKQHKGSIHVYSEKGLGSTFKIFLPQVMEKGEKHEEGRTLAEEPARGRETVLVAEDDELVRALCCNMLEKLGYQVLSGENPGRCIEAAKNHKGPISLLMTDVVMPGMNGKDLYNTLHALRPDLKVLFISGYAADVIGHHGVVDNGTHFIQKPFSIQALSRELRHALDS